MKKIKIGNKTINTNIFLAPMAGWTDLSFRLISREYGAKFCFYEMLDANSMIFDPQKNDADLIKTIKKDLPIAGQIVGSNVENIVKASKIFTKKRDMSFLDINSACPVKKITKKKAGAYLLKTPKILFKIIKTLSNEIDLPITVKLRLGYDKIDLKEILKITKGCEKNGASALFVHGRTRAQGYSGDIDYKTLKTIKEESIVPIICSGNIFSPKDAKEMFEKTLCDGILVARGSLGNPWIFKNIESYLKTGEIPPPPTILERKKALLKHLSLIEKYKQTSEFTKRGQMRRISQFYIKGTRNAAKIREAFNRTKSYEEILEIINSIEDGL